MKQITNSQQIQNALKEIHADEIFDSNDLPFRLLRYEKGEILTGPEIPYANLLFLVKGTIQVYGLKDDARIIPVSLATTGTMLGDLEYCTGDNSPLFSEAVEETYCIALPIRKTRDILDRDVRFLHHLIESLVSKVYLTTSTDTPIISVEEKLLHYMSTECKNGELLGINQATYRLSCSRRQLQRVLKELCDQEKIRKTGKGKYKLVK